MTKAIDEVKARFHNYLDSKARELTGLGDAEYLRRIQKGIIIIETPQEMSKTAYKLYALIFFMQYVAEWWGGWGYEEAFKKRLAKVNQKMLQQMYLEEYGHARLVRFGGGHFIRGPLAVLDIDPTQFMASTPQEQIYLLRIFQHPGFTDIYDLTVFNFLQDQTADHQLRDIALSPFGPAQRIIELIEEEEKGHVEHGKEQIRCLASTPKGKKMIQAALNKWFPHALDVFGKPDSESKNMSLFLGFDIKGKTNDGLRAEFLAEISPLLNTLGLVLPRQWQYMENRPF